MLSMESCIGIYHCQAKDGRGGRYNAVMGDKDIILSTHRFQDFRKLEEGGRNLND
jgi:hypothetical protein